MTTYLLNIKLKTFMATKSKKTGAAKTSTATKAKDTSRTASSDKQVKQSGDNQMEMGEELKTLFVDMLKDIYWAEKALTKALPKMAKASTTEELRQGFEEHLTQTEEHIKRLEQVFELIGQKPQAKKCEAMEGLQKEAEEIMEDTKKGTLTRDVGLIMAAQKVEHYEIATYGGLATLANTFGMTEVADLLEQTLEEEKQTDENLTYIAENNVNFQAGTEDDGEEDDEETDETEDDDEADDDMDEEDEKHK
jgi:ferritin-like metal-binding protein YciE